MADFRGKYIYSDITQLFICYILYLYSIIVTATYNSFAVACSSLLVLAAQEQSVALLFQLLCVGTLLRAAGHLLHRLRGARLALLPYPVPRLFGWLADRFKNALSPLDFMGQIRDKVQEKLGHHPRLALTALYLQCAS